jgi:dsDNA-specific endonuclease/ATPase MutS2
MGTIENLIDANDREHIEDANWAKVIVLETKASGMNLFMGPDDVRAMIGEGRSAIRKAQAEGKLK